jgi:hypothetical protein
VPIHDQTETAPTSGATGDVALLLCLAERASRMADDPPNRRRGGGACGIVTAEVGAGASQRGVGPGGGQRRSGVSVHGEAAEMLGSARRRS